MKRQFFGTDGIRGKANVYPLTSEFAHRLGQSAAQVLGGDAESDAPQKVVIGKDTRQSGDMLECAIAAGLNSMGVDVILAGVIPTPAVAFLTRKVGAFAGIVISASHNPFGDNGIKFFGPDGFKLDDEVEFRMEQAVLSKDPIELSSSVGRTESYQDAVSEYVAQVIDSCGLKRGALTGMKIALDAANGASYLTSPQILRELGATVEVFHNEPTGININEDCGCTHADVIEKLVRDTGAHVGIAHDGDADRVLIADETGSVLDGDELMAIAALFMIEKGELPENTLVATVMSNAGLEKALTAAGGKVKRTGVGDRYVIEAMREGGYTLGGEQSGHFIFLNQATTGDGIVAAVQLLQVCLEKNVPFSQLRTCLKKLPQVQRNIRVTRKPEVDDLIAAPLIEGVERELGDAGRVLVRYSGTEPLMRLLVEGESESFITDKIEAIAEAIRSEIGA